MTVLIIAGALLAAGVLLAAGGFLADWAGTRWGRRSARRTIATEERRANHGPPPGIPDRRRRNDGPAGRHRRPEGDDLPTGALSATGILRRVTSEDAGRPAIARATRRQLRDAGTSR